MQLWDYIKAEFAVLRGAPLSFVGLVVLSVAAGIGIGAWHYSERLEAREGQIQRYRVALGIDPASKGALVELNNQELALKAQSTVTKLRELSTALNAKLEGIQKQADAKKIDETQAFKAKQAAMQEVSQDFDSNLASDAHNVDNELRGRLDPKAIAHVVRVPGLVSSDGTRVPITALFKGSGFDTFYIKGLADEIEQMAKLLPSDSARKH